MFYRHRVYLVDRMDLICRFCGWWKGSWPSSLGTLPLELNCGFIPTSTCWPSIGVYSQGCPGGLGSARVMTSSGDGSAAWIGGTPRSPGAQEAGGHGQTTCDSIRSLFQLLAAGVWGAALAGVLLYCSGARAGTWGERGYIDGPTPCMWLSSSALLPEPPCFP